MKLTHDNTKKIEEIARKYFRKYQRFMGDNVWDDGFGLYTGGNFFFRNGIGEVSFHLKMLEVDVKQKYSPAIRKICQEIENKEGIKVWLKIIIGGKG